MTSRPPLVIIGGQISQLPSGDSLGGGAVLLDQTSPQTQINGMMAVQGFSFAGSPTVGSWTEGKLYYDATWKTLSSMQGRDLIVPIGQLELRRAYNNTGSQIDKGKAVYTNGTYNAGTNDVATVALADASSVSKYWVLGLAAQDIPTGQYGDIAVRGHVLDVDTSSFTNGDSLYLSDSTPGALTTALPAAGNYKVRVGRVITAATAVNHGRINVRLLTAEKLDDLANVVCPSPSVDEVLRFNGTEWVNGAPATSSAGPGIDFFSCTPVVNSRTSPAGINQAGTSGNGIQINSLSKTPIVTAEQTIAGLSNNDTRAFVAWIYNTALGRTNIDAGLWSFYTYAAVSSAAGTATITRQVYQIVPPASGTVTTSGSGTNSRTATITSSQFAGTYFSANATNTTASYLQTPTGIYQITAISDANTATITVPTGYSNENAVAFNIWNKLFGSTLPAITSTGTNYSLYQISSSQGAFAVAATDKLGEINFCTSNNSKTFTTAYNGTAHNTYFETPLITLHNNLAGLDGGTSNQMFHFTSAEHTNLAAIAALSYGTTAFVKQTGASTYALDTNVYLTTVTAHNVLSTTHGDTAAGSVVRGDIMYGNSTPKWDRLAFPGTPTGKILQCTATDVAWSTNPLTIGASASVAGSNTGDQTISDATISITNITTNNASTAAHGFAPIATAPGADGHGAGHVRR